MKEVSLPVSAQARLDELLEEIRQLKEGGSKEALDRAEALTRFMRSGELAAPMTSRQVMFVLNMSTVHAVEMLVNRRKLQRRFGKYGFHPDDVRAFLESRRDPNREAINSFLQRNAV